jgi:hypothetical protein
VYKFSKNYLIQHSLWLSPFVRLFLLRISLFCLSFCLIAVFIYFCHVICLYSRFTSFLPFLFLSFFLCFSVSFSDFTYVSLSVFLSVGLSAVRLSVILSFRLSVSLSFLLFDFLSAVFLSLSLSASLCAFLPFCLSDFVFLSLCMYVICLQMVKDSPSLNHSHTFFFISLVEVTFTQ